MGERDLVEAEGVNAGSGEATWDAGDPVAGGDPARAEEQQRPEPAGTLVGPPPDPDTAQAYGSQPPA